uniref:Secreted protein n=1 Tax=Steinernema glaseri TaxID=37863 RepID=A0A1I7YH05_9BILA
MASASLRLLALLSLAAIAGAVSLRRQKGAMSKAELLDLFNTVPYAKKTTQRIQILAPYLPSSGTATTQRRQVDAPTIGTPPLLVAVSPFTARRSRSS